MDNAIYGSAKAWVNFNGNSGASPVIRQSYNVSSVTRNSAGNYTVTMTNAMVDANYSVSYLCRLESNSGAYQCPNLAYGNVPTTTAFNIVCFSNSGGFTDSTYNFVSVIR